MATAPSRRSDAGFSLAELMIILVVIGLGMAVAVPNLYSANQNWRLKESIGNIETSLRRARSIAVTRGVDVRVSIDAENRRVDVDLDSDGDGSFDQAVASHVLSREVLFDSIDFDGETAVVFDERGAPDNAGSLVIKTRETDFQREIMVSAGSGSVSILEVVAEQN